MKDNYLKIFVILWIVPLLLLMSSCNRNVLVTLDYAEYFYVTENNNDFAYQFAYNDIIDEISVNTSVSTNKELKCEFIAETAENGTQMMIDNYYVYGLIFDLEYEEFIFESVELLINNSFYQVIDLNINVKKMETSSSDVILPISIPFIGDLSEEIEWIILPLEDIEIVDVEVISTLDTDYDILVNSLSFVSNKVYTAKEKIYINANMYYEQFDKINYVVLKVNYIDGENNQHTYITDLSLFGDVIQLLRDKIC